MSVCENFFYSLVEIVVCLVLIRVYTYLKLGISKSNTCLIGKTVLITGGNSGMGYETASALAARGGRIIIADKDDATESVKKIIEETNNKNIIYKHLDLTSLTSVREFAKEINSEEGRLDILINNAGIGASREYTGDELPIVMQTNHFGPFLLTHLLIDLLKKSAPSRIIFVSSLMAFIGRVTLNNINKTSLKGWGDYEKSKLMNIITSYILAKKLAGSGVTSNAVHPGIVNTPIFRKAGDVNSGFIWKWIVYKILLPICGKTAWEGAQTQIECALSKKLEKVSGKYFADCRTFVQPWQMRNRELCMKLWEKSEELVRLKESEKL